MKKWGGWRGPLVAAAALIAGCAETAHNAASAPPQAAPPTAPANADTAPEANVRRADEIAPAALPALPGPAFDGLPAAVVAAEGAEAVILATGDGPAGLVLVAPDLPAGAGSCGQVALDAYALAARNPPDNIEVRFVFAPAATADAAIVALAAADAGAATPAGVVNLGGCDGADGVAVWDADGPAERSLVMDALIQAGDSEGVAAGFAARPATAPTHHRAFQAAGVPAVGLTLPQGDGEQGARVLARVVNVFDAFVGGARP